MRVCISQHICETNPAAQVARTSLSLLPCTKLTHLRLVLQRNPYGSSRLLWNHILQLLSPLPQLPRLPPLERITFEYREDLAILDPEHWNVHLDKRQMAALEAVWLQIPTLKRVEFRPPEGEAYARFGARDREHVRDVLGELDRRGMLAV